MKHFVKESTFFLRFVGVVMSFFLIKFFLFFYINKGSTDKNKVLILAFDPTGDLIFYSGALTYLNSIFSRKEIYFYCDKGQIDAVSGIFKNTFEVDKVRVRRDFLYSLKFWRRLKKEGFSEAIYFGTEPSDIFNYGFLLKLVSPKIFLYEGEKIFQEKPLHFSDRARLFLVSLGKRTILRGDIIPSANHTSKFFDLMAILAGVSNVPIPNHNILRTRVWFPSSNLLLPKRYVVFGVGAGAQYRRWPLDRFLTVMEYVHKKGFIPVVVGNKQERDTIGLKVPRNGYILNFAGETSLNELKYIISRCSFYIGNETSFVHIAIAEKKPSVCILGLGHFARMSLYGYESINKWVFSQKIDKCLHDNWMCGYNYPNLSPCIDAVSVDDVIGAIDQVLLEIGHANPQDGEFKISYLEQ
jgi:ADP-heptose:LPS heptosyltransferase